MVEKWTHEHSHLKQCRKYNKEIAKSNEMVKFNDPANPTLWSK